MNGVEKTHHPLTLEQRLEIKTKLSMPPLKIVTECHEEWELDAQGACKVPGIGLVSLLNFGDLYSHVRATWACLNRRKAAGPDYQLALRKGFFCFGMPQMTYNLTSSSAWSSETNTTPVVAYITRHR